MQVVSPFRRCLPQVLAVNIKNTLLLVYGLTMGMPTILIPNLNGSNSEEMIVLNRDGISWLGAERSDFCAELRRLSDQSEAEADNWAMHKNRIQPRSLNLLSVPLGCILSGTITKSLGRIRSMQFICVLFFGSFLLYHFAWKSWHVYLALFMTGFSGGLLEAPTLIYTVEITEPDLRGSMCSTSTTAIAIGVLVSFILGTVYPWRTMAIINSTIPIISLVLLLFIPESPYWLITRNRLEQAKKNLAWLRGWTTLETVEEEFKSICNELELEPKVSVLGNVKGFCKVTFLKPYALICLTFVLANFGTPQVNVYAVTLFQILKVSINSYYATILVGVVEILGSVFLVVLVKFLGKRVLSFVTQFGISLCFLTTGLYAYSAGVVSFEQNSLDDDIITRFSWVPLVAILSIAFFSYLMTYTLPWVIMGEIFPNHLRDNASGISAATGYVISFIFNKTFLNLVHSLSLPVVFWIYGASAFLGIILLYYFLPETEGKTLSEITEYFAGRAHLGTKMTRSKGFVNDVETMKNSAL